MTVNISNNNKSKHIVGSLSPLERVHWNAHQIAPKIGTLEMLSQVGSPVAEICSFMARYSLVLNKLLKRKTCFISIAREIAAIIRHVHI